jgi:ribonuclease HI
LPGARLSSLTQSIAYKGIKEMREPVSRKKTDEIVKGVQAAVKDAFSFHPKSPTIWKSIRHRDIGRNIRNFLWKSMHGAHRLGKWWLNIPECEERANCVHCGAEETLDHILLECPSPGQSEVWKLAEQLWTKKESSWPAVSMGTILGSGLAIFKDDSGKPRPALARLYKILMTESAHVIWKLRCDSVIGREGTPPSTHEVHNRWVKVMNERLEIDVNLTNKLKYGKQHALSPALVLDTWCGTLLDEDTLPDDWLREPGVLVGITPKRSLRSPSPPIGWWGRNR